MPRNILLVKPDAVVSFSLFFYFHPLQLVKLDPVVSLSLFFFFCIAIGQIRSAVKCMSPPLFSLPYHNFPHHPTHCMVRGDNHRFVFNSSSLSTLYNTKTTSRWQPIGPALGPSGLIHLVHVIDATQTIHLVPSV